MIWLRTPPWGRWAAAVTIAAVALWLEVRPPSTVEHPFATIDIPAGMVVDEANTELRAVPSGTFSAVTLGQTALRTITRGDPVLASTVGEPGRVVPEGWWAIEMPLPRGAGSGDRARIVLLDDGSTAEGLVVEAAEDDPLGAGVGLVAVAPEHAADVARAAGEGRTVVMISTP